MTDIRRRPNDPLPPPLPTPEQLAAARVVLAYQRRRAATVLLTAEHVAEVTRLVFSFDPIGCDPDPTVDPVAAAERTAGRVAEDILSYLASTIAPLLTDPPTVT